MCKGSGKWSEKKIEGVLGEGSLDLGKEKELEMQLEC
jgi:hypothetical protein